MKNEDWRSVLILWIEERLEERGGRKGDEC